MAIEKIITLNERTVVKLPMIGYVQTDRLIQHKSGYVEALVARSTKSGKKIGKEDGFVPVNVDQVREIVTKVGINRVVKSLPDLIIREF